MIGKLSDCVYLPSKKQPRSVRLSLGRAATLKVQDFVREHHAVGFQDRGGRSDRDRPDGQEVADGQHLRTPPSYWGL
jgi:hypothetical protein